MGCFLSCFRARPDDPSGALRDPLVRETRLGDAFLDDKTKLEASGGLEEEDYGNGGGVDEELRREANYLKSCGAISETPPEIRVVSSQISSEETNERNDTSNNAKVIKGTMLSEDNLSEGFNYDEHVNLRHEQNIDESTEHLPGVESVPQSYLQDKSSCQNINNQQLDSSDSPYPTPLVLRGDMHTPGTIYTAHKGNLRSGKRARTSRQFIYPVLRPIENKLQWTELRDDSSPVLSSNPPKRRNSRAGSIEKPEQTFPGSMTTRTELSKSAPFSFHANNAEQDEGVTSPEEPKNQNYKQHLLDGGELLKNNSDYGKHGVSSLSCWLKPSSADGESQSDIEGSMGKQPGYEKSVFTDVPIFVASGLNWDNDNPTPVLPKAWDGNGIPNTTTKYKEDQKVSWHATPFEERLLKVLSDEKPHHQRKISGKLIQLEENTE